MEKFLKLVPGIVKPHLIIVVLSLNCGFCANSTVEYHSRNLIAREGTKDIIDQVPMLSFQKRSFRLRTKKWFNKLDRRAERTGIWSALRFITFPNRYFVGNVVVLAIFVYTVDFFQTENKVFAGVEKYGKNMNVFFMFIFAVMVWVLKSVNLLRTACFACPFLVTSKRSNFKSGSLRHNMRFSVVTHL